MLDFLTRIDQNVAFERQENVKHVKSAIQSFTEKATPKDLTPYIELLPILEDFFIKEQNQEVIKYVAQRFVAKGIYDYIPSICNSFGAFCLTIRFIPKLENYTKTPPPQIVFNLLIASCKFSIKQKQLLQFAKSYFTEQFLNSETSYQFVENDGLIDILNSIVCKPTTIEIQDFILRISKYFKSRSLQPIIKLFEEFNSIVRNGQIPSGNEYFACMYISSIFSTVSRINPDISHHFMEYEVPKHFQLLFKTLELSQIIKIITLITEESNSNFTLFTWLRQICVQSQELQDISFQLFIKYFSQPDSKTYPIDHFFPIQLWFTDFCRPLNELLIFIQLIEKRDLLKTKNLLQVFLDKLDGQYMAAFKFIKKLYEYENKRFLTAEEMSTYGYLHAFVIRPPSDLLIQLFSIPNFEEITSQVFIKSETSIQSQAFQSIFESNLSVDLCTRFLNNVPTIENITCLLLGNSEQLQNKSCEILLSSFNLNSQELCPNFIQAGGLKWLDQTNNFYFVEFLSTIVERNRFKEVDKFISSLPKTHRIFQLPLSDIEKIVYGNNNMKHRPIRVVNLFYLLKPPLDIDPYNAYILGKSNYTSTGYDCPLINQIGNRYIKPQFINMLLSRPYEIGRFCDLQYDHFPLFQFFRGSSELKILRGFSGLSFWIKFYNSNDTPFFKNDFFKLVYEDNSIVILIDNIKSQPIKIQANKWNHVFLMIDQTLLGYCINLFINNQLYKINKVSAGRFSFASFEYSGAEMLFLGSTIRVFVTNSVLPYETIFQKGPGWIDPLSEEFEIMITPYSSFNSPYFELPSNCYQVPYFGFPFHFISHKRLSDLFTFLDNSRTADQFDSIFQTLLSINLITIRNTSIFWHRMLRSMKNTSFKTENIHEAITSVIRLKNDEWILSSILFDNELWKCINNQTLIEILFKDFQTVDFSKIPGFELFMTTVILNNQENEGIINLIFENCSYLSELIHWIIEFLGFAHAIDLDPTLENINIRSETVIQHTIVDSLISLVKKSTSLQPLNRLGLTFDTLGGFLSVSKKKLAAHLFDLITQIEKVNPGFIDVNDALIVSIAQLANYADVWSNVFWLIEINLKFAPLLLSLIWATTLSMINTFSSNDNTFKIQDEYEKGLRICENNLLNLYQSKKCMMILLYWFPLIFNYPILFQMNYRNEKLSSTPSSMINISRSSDFSESYVFQDDDSKVLDSTTNFLIELISSVFSSFGFEIPKNSSIKTKAPIEWLINSPFSALLSNLLLMSNNTHFYFLFPSFFLCSPSFHQNRAISFIPTLSTCLFKRIEKDTPYLKTIFEYLIFFIGEKCFFNNEQILMADLFMILKKTKTKFINGFMVLFFGLISYSSHLVYQDLLRVLINNLGELKTIVINTNNNLPLFYSIYLMSKEKTIHLNQFITKLSTQFTSPRDQDILGLIQRNSLTPTMPIFIEMSEAFSKILEVFSKTRKRISKEISPAKFDAEMTELSKCVNNYRKNTNKKCLNAAIDYKKKKKILESSFVLIEERMQWERFMTSIHDLAISESSFAPKCFHLSPRSLRFMVPQILTPSPYTPFLNKKKNKADLYQSSSVNGLYSYQGDSYSEKVDIGANLYYETPKIDNKDEAKLIHIHDKHLSNENNNSRRAYEQTYNNQPDVYLDERQVSTYTDLGIPSSLPQDVPLFLNENTEVSILTAGHTSSLDSKTDSSSILQPETTHGNEIDKMSSIQEETTESKNKQAANSSSLSTSLVPRDKSQMKKAIEMRKCVKFNSTNMNTEVSTTQFNTMKNIGKSVLFESKESIQSASEESIGKSDASSPNFYRDNSIVKITSPQEHKDSPSRIFQLSMVKTPDELYQTALKKSSSSHQSVSSNSDFASEVIWQYHHHTKNLFSDSNIGNFKSLFESMFTENHFYSKPCRIIRHKLSINSVLFVYHHAILILTYSTMNNNEVKLLPIEDNKQLHIFLEEIFLGHWGETKIFASHVVLVIPISSLIYIKQQKRPMHKTDNSKESNAFEFSSFTCGHFIIEVNDNEISNFKEILRHINEKIFNQLPRELLLPNHSAEALILAKNEENCRSFVDLSNYPFFPASPSKKDKNTTFPNDKKTENMLSAVLPFTYLAHENIDEVEYDSIPANFYFTSGFFMDGPLTTSKKGYYQTQMLRPIEDAGNQIKRTYSEGKMKSLRKKKCGILNQRLSKNKLSHDFSVALQKVLALREGLKDKENLVKWLNNHFLNSVPSTNPSTVLPFSVDNFSIRNNQKHITDLDVDQIPQKLKLQLKQHQSARFFLDRVEISYLHSSVTSMAWSVHIEPTTLRLVFLNYKGKKIFQLHDHYFTFASSMNVSNNGLFLSIDFEFGLTRIWKIKYKWDKTAMIPNELEQLSDFSWSSKSTSLISGTHFICASKLNTEVVLWEINAGTIHRILKFATLVTAIAMDDEFNAIWIATSSHAYYYSINGQRLADVAFDTLISRYQGNNIKITTMSAMPLNYADNERAVVCGCEDGGILILIPRIETGLIDVKILNSMHSCRITRITFHPNRWCFISSDKNGLVYIWSACEKHLALDCYENCAVCNMKHDRFCEHCGRAICSNCTYNKRICSICHAFNLYIHSHNDTY